MKRWTWLLFVVGCDPEPSPPIPYDEKIRLWTDDYSSMFRILQ